ncbi:MAG: peptidylprolyl isomerase [Marinifilaceae bacterium]
MNKSIFLLVLFCLSYSLANGRNSRSDTLFTINDQGFSTQKFLNYYKNKRLGENNQPQLSIEEALDIYIHFHLKVLEAKKQGLDTLPQFKKEFRNYSEQILTPYLYPVTISEEKIREAYRRMQYFLKARHILIKVKPNASSRDTLEAYNKAILIRNRLLKGEDFAKLAKQHSADLSVRNNKGNLGYFTVFQMIYPFENSVYALQVDEISQPARTQFGYHIIQLLDKKKNPGKIKVAHLMIAVPRKANSIKRINARKKIDSLYTLLNKGKDFSELVKQHSDDKKSAENGGILPWFGWKEMFPEFENAAFALRKNGDLSEPIATPFGWHIIKRLELKEQGNLEDSREQLIQQIKKSGRCNIPKEKLILELKTKYKFKEDRSLLSNFYSILDYAYADLSVPIFSIADSSYSQVRFAEYLSQQPSKEMNEDFRDYINRIYDNFINNSILAFHKQKLIEREPKIRELLKEYYNGILVFNINDKMVWTPSVTDKIGLTNFFKKHYEKFQKEYGYEVLLESIRGIVVSNYQDTLQKRWLEQLQQNNRIKINQTELKRLQQLYDK